MNKKKHTITVIIGEGPSPLGGPILPAANETVKVLATTKGKAKTEAMFITTLKPVGRLVEFIFH